MTDQMDKITNEKLRKIEVNAYAVYRVELRENTIKFFTIMFGDYPNVEIPFDMLTDELRAVANSVWRDTIRAMVNNSERIWTV